MRGLFVSLAMIFTGCKSTQPVAPVPDETTGSHQVGVRFLEAWDANRAQRIPLTVWYPALPNEGEPHWGYARGVLDAPMADVERVPIVLYSHGNHGAPHASVFLADELAAQGYVVAAPAHRFDTVSDADTSLYLTHTVYRPVDMSLALDRLVDANADASDPLFGKLDTGAVGAVGHSWGAFTVQQLAGYVLPIDRLLGVRGTVEELGFSWPWHARDPRIGAAVSIATCRARELGPEGHQHIDIPTLYVGGTRDRPACEVDYSAAAAAAHTPGATLVRIDRATHYAFTNLCDIDPKHADFYQCADPPRDWAEVRGVTNRVVADFFGLNLLKDDRYGAWLQVGTQ